MGMRAVTGFPALLVAAAMVGLVALCAAEPRVSLRVPPYPSALFPNFSSVVLPADGYTSLEILVEGALAEIRPSSVRVTLNEMPMALFTSVNPMPAGLRSIVRLGQSMNPDYSIRKEGESILTLVATDTMGTNYRGQFYLSIDTTKAQPEIARTTKARLQQNTVAAPPQHRATTITFDSDWPARRAEQTLLLEGEVTDAEGLRRIVFELNGKDIEEISLQNERPVRYQNGRIVRSSVAGRVDGNGTAVRFAIPIRLQRNRLNVIAVRAENLVGLSTRSDRTVELPK